VNYINYVSDSTRAVSGVPKSVARKSGARGWLRRLPANGPSNDVTGKLSA